MIQWDVVIDDFLECIFYSLYDEKGFFDYAYGEPVIESEADIYKYIQIHFSMIEDWNDISSQDWDGMEIENFLGLIIHIANLDFRIVAISQSDETVLAEFLGNNFYEYKPKEVEVEPWYTQ